MKRALSTALLIALAAPQALLAQAADPAVGSVQAIENSLIQAMKAGGGAGMAGRSRIIAPAIDRNFDIALMTRLSVGPQWTQIPADQQAQLVSAFRAYTIAQYAKNFDSFGGERFVIMPQVETRGLDKLVRTNLVSPGGSTESLNYRLRQSGGQWKVIDVYYRNAISQLATRRADFERVLKTGGAPALIGHLNRLAARPD